MTVSQLINAVSSALSLENANLLTQGGQKIVLKGTISDAPAVAKIVCVLKRPGFSSASFTTLC